MPWTSLPSCTPGELSDWVWLLLRVWDCGPFYVDTTLAQVPPPPVAETTAASSGASTAEPATAAASAPSTAEPATAAASTAEPATAAPSMAEPATAAPSTAEPASASSTAEPASASATAEPAPAEAEHSNMFRASLGVPVQVAGFAVGHSAQVDWDCGASYVDTTQVRARRVAERPAAGASTDEPPFEATQAEHSNMFRARLGVHVQVAGFAVWGLVPRSSLLSRLGEQPPAGPRTHGSGIHRLT